MSRKKTFALLADLEKRGLDTDKFWAFIKDEWKITSRKSIKPSGWSSLADRLVQVVESDEELRKLIEKLDSHDLYIRIGHLLELDKEGISDADFKSIMEMDSYKDLMERSQYDLIYYQKHKTWPANWKEEAIRIRENNPEAIRAITGER